MWWNGVHFKGIRNVFVMLKWKIQKKNSKFINLDGNLVRI